MTPMIDVVFLLLIFFVCTASFQISEPILISPLTTGVAAAAEVSAEPELERVLIAVIQHNSEVILTVNNQLCASPAQLSKLLAALAQIDHTLPIILDIADEVSVGTAIDIYDRCRLASFQKIQFAIEAMP